ncbi:MAG: hypothetical protein IIW22_05000 [Erysipelotrichaceae bacterium]|nr:hypothetical protein [Erysipelotrichaceae bacterium]
MDNRVKDLMERGFSELTPDCFDQIMAKVAELPQPEVRTEELNRTHTYERARVKQRRVVASFATAAVAVFCLISVRWYDTVKVTDEIYIDVNPSIVLELNSKGKVVRTEGRNGDGDDVVDASAEQLKGVKDPAEAVTVLMEEMNSEDYFHDNKGTVLVSWYTESSEKDEAPLEEVCGAVDTYAADNELELTVYKQSIEKSDEIDQEAEEAGMPVARYAYYKKLSDDHKVSLDKIKDKNLDEVKEYMDDLDDKKKEDKKPEKTEPQTPVEQMTPAVTEEDQSKKKENTSSSEEEKSQKKDNTSSSEEEKPKKTEDTTTKEDKPSHEETSSGDEPSSGDDTSSSSSSSSDEEKTSGAEASNSSNKDKNKDAESGHGGTEESGEADSE